MDKITLNRIMSEHEIIQTEKLYVDIQCRGFQNRASQGEILKGIKAPMSPKEWKNYIDNDLKELWEKETGFLSFDVKEADTLIRLYEFGEKHPAFLRLPGMTFERFKEDEKWIAKRVESKSGIWSQEVLDKLDEKEIRDQRSRRAKEKLEQGVFSPLKSE